MGRTGRLKNVERQLVKDLTESTVSLKSLGEKYGVTRQAIFLFLRRKQVKRPKREHTERCSICQRLLAIAKKPDSDFIVSQTIHEQLKLGRARIAYHIGVLRRKGLVSWNFGKEGF